MRKIYLDHSATTPVDKKVLEAMMSYYKETFGNASSIHSFGQDALAGVDQARAQVAGFLNCEREEVVFTSGATESNNLAITGLIKALKKKNKGKMHVITSLVEHDAVLEPFMDLERAGFEVTHLPVGHNGTVDAEKFKHAIRDNTVLASVMYVNSEVGAVMPIRRMGEIIRGVNEERAGERKKSGSGKKGEAPLRIYFHTDATQAVNFFNCNVKRLNVDMLSLSGHKIYGPKGIGALYVRTGTPLESVQKGGHQERNLRSGTLNVPGIVGLGAAIELLGGCGENGEPSAVQEENNGQVAKFRNELVRGIAATIPDAVLNTDREFATPSHAHFSFLGVEGESILMSLDLEGIAVSTGSACASGTLKASHVLLAMGIKKEVAHNSIRFTLGKHNTEAEIKRVVEVLPSIIDRLRKMNPLYKK